MSIRRAYGAWRRGQRTPPTDAVVVAAAFVVSVGCWRGSAPAGVLGGALAVAGLRLLPSARQLSVAWLAVAFVLLGAAAGLRAEQAWHRLAPDQLGSVDGWVRIVDDPQPYPGATRVIVEVDGQRFETWARGRARKLRVGEWRGGEFVRIRGQRVPLSAERRGRVAWQHVVGELRIDWVTDVAAGGPVDRASNRVRAAIERGGATLPGDDGSLFRGLVVGDDRDQPREMIERFRASGLSHLTAVSGQNVSFVLAAAGPLLRALTPWARWALTLALIAWFVSLTRFEPSIVRAGTMAALSATGFVMGRERAPARVLAVAVTLLLLIDPLLVGSVGFWLSVGATAGVVVVGPRMAARLDRLGLLAMPVGVTVGAQIGVVVPVVLVFGRLPLVSVPANLLAVPVAGFVMLYGLPAGLLAGAVPTLAPVVMLPCRWGVRWVDTVSVVAAACEPGGGWTWFGWAVLIALGAMVARGARP